MSDGASRAEWRWAIAVALVVVAISTLPYAAGILAQTPGVRFVGAVFDLEDYNSHLAKMWQGYRGEWRYRLLFTPEEHAGAYLQTFYVALGHLARLLGWGLPLTYHLARVVASVALLLAAYWFISLFAGGEVRRVAFLLVATSSGLGWLAEIVRPTPAGGVSPIDFWLVDAYTFFSLFTFPHFCAAIALLLLLYGVLLRLAEEAGCGMRNAECGMRTRYFVSPMKLVWVVLISWGLGLIHPYALLLADLVPALYLAWWLVARRWLPVGLLIALGVMGIAQAPLLLYDYRVFTTNPVFQAWSAQNVTLSPPPLYYCLGYGLVAVLAVWGIRAALRASPRAPFLLVWVTAAFVLAYLPWGLQRRFVEGIQVGLSVLAGYGLVQGLMPALARPLGRVGRFLRCDPRRVSWTVQVLLLTLAALSNLYLVATYTFAAATRHPTLFRTADEVAAAGWLATHAGWDETVLAAYEDGGWIAGAVGQRVVVGHWAETVDLAAKRRQVAAFYAAGTPDADRRAWLERWNVRYVYVGPRERALGAFDPAATDYLEPVFWRGQAAVFRVRRREP